jgi:hypothetical protein
VCASRQAPNGDLSDQELNDPVLNKGTAFTEDERRRLRLDGLRAIPVPASSSTRETGDISMPGTWTLTGNAVAPIHTFTAPEDGWLVTSHIVELPSEPFVVDAP